MIPLSRSSSDLLMLENFPMTVDEVKPELDPIHERVKLIDQLNKESPVSAMNKFRSLERKKKREVFRLQFDNIKFNKDEQSLK